MCAPYVWVWNVTLHNDVNQISPADVFGLQCNVICNHP